MHDIAQKQIFFYKLPELEPDPDLVMKFSDPDPAKRSGSDRIRIRIRNTGYSDQKSPETGLKYLPPSCPGPDEGNEEPAEEGEDPGDGKEERKEGKEGPGEGGEDRTT